MITAAAQPRGACDVYVTQPNHSARIACGPVAVLSPISISYFKLNYASGGAAAGGALVPSRDASATPSDFGVMVVKDTAAVRAPAEVATPADAGTS